MTEIQYPAIEFINEICNPTKDFEEVKKIILESKNLLKSIDYRGGLLIHRACKAGNINLVKFLYEKNKDHILKKTDVIGADCLQYAVIAGNLELVKYIISLGADPTQKYPLNTSILYFALKYEKFDIFEYLHFTYKLNIDEPLTENGVTALYMAMEQGNKKLFEYLLKFTKPGLENHGYFNYLVFAVHLKDSYYLEELLKKGAKYEPLELYGFTALSLAAEDKNNKHFQLIIKFAANVKSEKLPIRTTKIIQEYNALCDKWCRNYDIYTVRYFCELLRLEALPKEEPNKILEDPKLQKIYEIINTVPHKPETILL